MMRVISLAYVGSVDTVAIPKMWITIANGGTVTVADVPVRSMDRRQRKRRRLA